jgi:ADP-ribose pyrophosphatase YjhB (NUDIX family)
MMFENTKTCSNCMYSNTVEVIDPVCGSLAQSEIARKMREETGLDITKALQMKYHYCGVPQIVRHS